MKSRTSTVGECIATTPGHKDRSERPRKCIYCIFTIRRPAGHEPPRALRLTTCAQRTGFDDATFPLWNTYIDMTPPYNAMLFNICSPQMIDPDLALSRVTCVLSLCLSPHVHLLRMERYLRRPT